MDKVELKKVLHEQFAPMTEAVQRKLEYLQSEEVFTDNPYYPFENDNEGDSELLSAFGGNTNVQPPRPAQSPAPAASPRAIPVSPAGQSAAAPAQPQNMAARIAALRGISMPGDYLARQKKQ